MKFSNDERRAGHQRMAEELAEWGRQWRLEADMVRCPYCHSVQLATQADRAFLHDPGCAASSLVDQYPWRSLAWILRSLRGCDQCSNFNPISASMMANAGRSTRSGTRPER